MHPFLQTKAPEELKKWQLVTVSLLYCMLRCSSRCLDADTKFCLDLTPKLVDSTYTHSGKLKVSEANRGKLLEI
jgi:hypothetical protein